MAQIKKLQIEDETLYPVTIPQAVVDPTSGKSVRTELDELLKKNESSAIELIRTHNPYLIFQGFASTTTSTPATNTANHAWIAIESGTIFGITVIKGQIIVANGTIYRAEFITPYNNTAYFIINSGWVDYNTTAKTITFPAGYALNQYSNAFKSTAGQVVDLSPLWGFIQYIVCDFNTGLISALKYDNLSSIDKNKLVIAVLYSSTITANFRYKINGVEFGITFPNVPIYAKEGKMVSSSPAVYNTTTNILTFPSSTYFVSAELDGFKTPSSLSIDLTSVEGNIFYVYFDIADNTIKSMLHNSSLRLDPNHYIIAVGYANHLLSANFQYTINGLAPIANTSISKAMLNFNVAINNNKVSFPFQTSANGALLTKLKNTIIDINLSGVVYNPALYYSFAQITVAPEQNKITLDLYSSPNPTGSSWVKIGSFIYIGDLTEKSPVRLSSSLGVIIIIPNEWAATETGYQGGMAWDGYGLSQLAFGNNYSLLIDSYLLDQRISAIELNKSLRLILPSTLHAVVGKEFNLYYDSITLMPEIGLGEPQFIFDIQCAVGEQLKRGYRVTPVSGDIGSHTFTVNVYDNYQNLIETKTTTLIIVDAAITTGGKQILCIGDSTTDDTGQVTTTLQANFAAIANTPTFLGSHGVAPANHEGRTGKTFAFYANGGTVYKFTVTGALAGWVKLVATYVNAIGGDGYILVTEKFLDGSGNGYVIAEIWRQPASIINAGWTGTLTNTDGDGPDLTVTNTEVLTGYSPFNDNNGIGNLDISYYMTRFGLSGNIDIFDIDLGINDSRGVFLSESARQQIITYAKNIIDAVLLSYPTCKVIVNLPKSCCSTRSNNPTQHDTYRTNIHRLRELIIENFDEFVYDENVYVSAVGLTLDRYFGYSVSSVIAGSRYSETLTVHSDDVHPRSQGYDQVADAKYAVMLYVLNN